MIKIISTLLLLIGIVSTSQANLLESGFKIEYDVNYNGMELGVSTRHLLFTSSQNAIYKSTTTPEGFAALLIDETITEISKLSITRKEIKPMQYTETKTKKGKIEKQQLNFDWRKKELINSYSKVNEKLEPHTHDLLSFQLQIMQDLQQHKTNMQYRVATKKHTRSYSLNVLGKETIETAMGEFDVIKLQSKSSEGESQFTFWAAPALEYLPIKIQKINDKGKTFSFTIRSFSLQK